MLSLFKSEKFQKDYTEYQCAILEMPVGQLQTETKLLLTKLVNTIKTLDNNITEMSIANRMPTPTSNLRNDIISIRTQLDSKIQDWNKIKLNN
jgi:hypothetical protein